MSTTNGRSRERRINTATENVGLKNRLKQHDVDNKPQSSFEYVPDGEKSPLETATIARVKNTLVKGEVGSLSKVELARLEKHEKELRVWLRSKMLTRKEMELKPGPDPRFRQAVNALSKSEMTPEFVQVASRWKNVRRQLDPSDPNVGNLELIRPVKR